MLRADPRVARVESIVSLDPRLTPAQYRLLYRDPAAIPDPFFARVGEVDGRRRRHGRTRLGRRAMLDDESVSLVRSIRSIRLPSASPCW